MGGQRAYTEAEVTAMADELAKTRHGRRNRAAYLFGILTGCRASEICTVRCGDVFEMDGTLREQIIIWRRHTKRQKTRLISATPKLSAVIKTYLGGEGRNVVHRDEYLFCQPNGRPISRYTLYRDQRRAALRLGLRGRVGGTHAMRKTFAVGVHDYVMELAAQGHKVDPLLNTRDALGHADVRCTEAYLEADLAVVVNAVKRVSERYVTKP
jgi:integrase/recombinase XerD